MQKKRTYVPQDWDDDKLVPKHVNTTVQFILEDDPDGGLPLPTMLQIVNKATGEVLDEKPLRVPHKGPPPKLPIPSARFHYDSFAVKDFSDWPKLQWMVEGLFHIGTLVMVWGASGAGKTAWLIDLAMSIAAGTEWSGRKVTKNHVLFCALEGAQGFRERVMAAAASRGFRPDLELRFIFDPVDLTDPEKVNGLADIAYKYGAKLIVIDTLAAALAGRVDENSNQQMAAIIDSAKRLSQMTEATVLLTHHTGHDTRNERGASALRAGVDTSISVNRRDRQRYWRVVKQRDGEEGFGGYFELLPYQFDEPGGEVVNSVIAQPSGSFGAEDAPGGKAKRKPGNRRKPSATDNAAASLGEPTTVRGATELQATILAKLKAYVQSRPEAGTRTGGDADSFTLEEAQQACRGVSRYHTRDVKRAIEFYQKAGVLELDGGGRIRLANRI